MNICSTFPPDDPLARANCLPGLTALVGRVPDGCTPVTIWAVDSDMALVHAQTAWCDTGCDDRAWRVVPVEALHHIGPGLAPFDADEVRRALGSGWGRVFRLPSAQTRRGGSQGMEA